MDLVHQGAVHQHRLHRGGHGGLGVAEEGHVLAALGEQAVVQGGIGVPGLLGGGVGTGTLALLLHRGAEALLVHRQAHLVRHLQGEVDGEAVGVVQAEGILPGQGAATLLLQRTGDLIEDPGAGGEGTAERLLLGVDRLADALELGAQLRVGLGHDGLAHRQQIGHGGLVVAQQAHRAHGPADESAQHVAAPLVAGAHTVRAQHQGAAHVVGDDPEAHVVLGIGAVHAPAELLRLLDDGEHLVDLVHVVLALQQVRDPLQAHAGVNRLEVELAQQRVVLAGARSAQVLVEHQVPDLQVAVRGLFTGPLRVRAAHFLGPVLGAAVVVPLAAGAGGAGLAGVPEDLPARERHDPLGRQTDLLGEHLAGLVVLLPDGDPHALGVQAVAALVLGRGHQLPGELDRTLLEVVAEGEVSGHLEEGAVTGGAAHVLDVIGADALLNTDGPRPGCTLGSHDVGDERHHPGDREQDRGVRGDEGGAGHHLVPPLLEEVEVTTTDLRCTHGWCPSWSGPASSHARAHAG